jgi:hypothetical protein
MEIVAQIEKNILQVLGEEADSLARQTQLVKRQRKISGSTFARILITAVLDNPLPSYTDLSQDAALLGVPITPQGLELRFTPEAAQFMREILSRLVERVITAISPATLPILQRFNGVYIRDSTVISLPAELAGIWPGCGGSAGDTAALKLQVRLNYATGQLEGPALQSGRQHDRSTPYGPEGEPAGSLELADLGYFSLAELQQRQEQGQFFLTRYKIGTALYTPQGEPLDLLQWLTQEVTTYGERPVLLGSQERIPVRLIAFRVSQEVADRHRQRLREYARKKGVTLRRETLLLAGWIILLTNVPEEKMMPREALVMARVRWQVEILFRVWKSHARIDEWRSHNPWRILCELYAKLAGQVILHWMLLTEWHRFPDRSLFKAAKALQKLAIPLALSLRQGKWLVELIFLFQECFHTCRVNKRRRKPATFQLLLGLEGLT